MIPAPPPLWPPGLGGVWLEELRNNFDAGSKQQAIDVAGAALGMFFVLEGARRGAWLNVLLGAVMTYVHGYRFLVGDRIDPCDLCRARSSS